MDKKPKWYDWLVLILLLPILLVASLIDLLHFRKGKKELPLQLKKNLQRESERKEPPLRFQVPFIEPVNPLPDKVFIERLDEVVCIQFESWNGLSGGRSIHELIIAEHPELKEEVFSFLKKHPIEDFLRGDRYDPEVFDANHWNFWFIFDDPSLNRKLSGYGWTEVAAPYLLEFRPILPEILSLREQAEREMRMWEVRKDMEAFLASKNQENCNDRQETTETTVTKSE